MKTLSLEITNPEPILKDLERLFAIESDSEFYYLSKPAQDDYENPLNLTSHKNAFGMEEYLLPEVIHLLGIRSMTVNKSFDLGRLNELSISMLESDLSKRDFLEIEPFVLELKLLFAQSRTIAFDDWSGFTAAASLWPALLENVIEGVANPQLEFIFYLGDPERKSTFQVDEVLHLLSRFSQKGAVTLAVDEREAINLWRVLNAVDEKIAIGIQTIHELKRKYFSLFKSMDITRLLVYSTSDAMVFSAEEQFVLIRKVADSQVELGTNARQNFVSGLSSGMSLGHGVPHSIALGLVVFGSSGQYSSRPALSTIQQYISGWIADLEKPDTIFLYQ